VGGVKQVFINQENRDFNAMILVYLRGCRMPKAELARNIGATWRMEMSQGQYKVALSSYGLEKRIKPSELSQLPLTRFHAHS